METIRAIMIRRSVRRFGNKPIEEKKFEWLLRVQEIRRLLDIPRHVLPIALVALGYAADDRKIVKRYHPERLYRNRWTGTGS